MTTPASSPDPAAGHDTPAPPAARLWIGPDDASVLWAAPGKAGARLLAEAHSAMSDAAPVSPDRPLLHLVFEEAWTTDLLPLPGRGAGPCDDRSDAPHAGSA